MLDTYAIKGLNNEQVRFLQAKEYLCPTHKYGVTFERGVMIDFGIGEMFILVAPLVLIKKGGLFMKVM